MMTAKGHVLVRPGGRSGVEKRGRSTGLPSEAVLRLAKTELAKVVALGGERRTVIRLVAGEAVVREWRVEDAVGLAAVAHDRRVSINLRDAFPHPYGVGDAERFIAMAIEKTPPTFFAIELPAAQRFVGGIGYTLHGDVERVGAEVGYWVGYEFWGRGIGSAALRAVTAHAFRTHEELTRLYAVPFASNPASAPVLERAGYRREGTLRRSVIKEGRILDQWMYAIIREEWEALERGHRPGRA